MPNRQLTKNELDSVFAPLLSDVRARLQTISNGDDELLFALRRKLAKELSYDERGKPMQRKLLKARLRAEQDGLCAHCREALPEKNAVLDRVEAMRGYTPQNTRLLCPACDIAQQEERGYA
jgi:UTP:GlnB (protein PII) uridylyltransferase